MGTGRPREKGLLTFWIVSKMLQHEEESAQDRYDEQLRGEKEGTVGREECEWRNSLKVPMRKGGHEQGTPSIDGGSMERRCHWTRRREGIRMGRRRVWMWNGGGDGPDEGRKGDLCCRLKKTYRMKVHGTAVRAGHVMCLCRWRPCLCGRDIVSTGHGNRELKGGGGRARHMRARRTTGRG